MTPSPPNPHDRSRTDFDVLIVGAGISGIGAACHLRTRAPGRSFAILEGRDAIGGTWDLFRFPGIRSDSDLFTFGFAFKPWTSDQLDRRGRPDPRLPARDRRRERPRAATSASAIASPRARWSSDEARWTVTAQRATTARASS